MAAKWNFVVLVSLEFRLADYGDVAADHTALTLDRAAAAKHLGRDHHSCCLQRGWIYLCGERSWHLGGCSGGFPGIAVAYSAWIVGYPEVLCAWELN